MKKSEQTLFRFAIVASTVAFAIYFWLPELGYPVAGSDLAAIQTRLDGYGALLEPTWVIYWGHFLLGVLVPAACYFYLPYSRGLFVVLQVFNMGSALLYGVRVLGPLESTLSYALCVVDGAIIAMMYFCEPLAERFTNGRSA